MRNTKLQVKISKWSEVIISKIRKNTQLLSSDFQQLKYPFINGLSKKEMDALITYIHSGYVSPEEAEQLFSDKELLKEAIVSFKKKYAVSALLLNAVKNKKEISAYVKLAFGIVSSYHEKVIKRAIAEKRMQISDAIHCCFEAKELNKLLKGFSEQLIPLHFYDKEDCLTAFANDELSFTTYVTIPTKNRSFKMMATNTYDLWQSLRDEGVAEKDTIQWLESTFKKKSVLFDIGACTGFFSMYASGLQEKAKVFSFEPQPVNFGQLNLNIMINNRSKKVKAYPIALSDHCGLSNFYSSFLVAGKAENMLAVKDLNEKEYQHVSGGVMYTVDKFVESNPRENMPTHLKIDVDGNELKILKGAEKTLRSLELKHILIELQDTLLPEVKKMLRKSGFTYQSGCEEACGPGMKIGNYVFEKK